MPDDFTTEKIEYDGVSLSRWDVGVSTMTGLLGGPEFEPRHIELPHRDGALFQYPRIKPRIVTVSGFVSPLFTGGDRPGSNRSLKEQYNRNLDKLFATFARRDKLVKLKRTRAYAASYTRGTGTDWSNLITTEIEVVPYAAPVIVQQAPWACSWSIDLFAPYPFFEDTADRTHSFTGPSTLTHDGHSDLRKMTIRMTAGGGGWTNPGVRNSSAPGAQILDMAVEKTLTSGQWVEVDTWNGTVKDQAGTRIDGLLDYTLNFGWFMLVPGTNSLAPLATAGGGTVLITYRQNYW